MDALERERIAVNEKAISGVEKSIAGIFNRISDLSDKLDEFMLSVRKDIGETSHAIEVCKKNSSKLDEVEGVAKTAKTIGSAAFSISLVLITALITVLGMSSFTKQETERDKILNAKMLEWKKELNK